MPSSLKKFSELHENYVVTLPGVWTQPRFRLTSSGQAIRTVLHASPKFSLNHLMSVFRLTSLIIHTDLSRAEKRVRLEINNLK